MFSDFDTEVESFEPIPETQRLFNDSDCQTVNLRASNQGTQTTNTQSIACETSSKNISSNPVDHSYDTDKLLAFLNRVVPYLEDELKSCDNSSNLNFKPNEFNNFENKGEETFDPSFRQALLKPDFFQGKVISCLSWNSSNMMLAIGCSELSHSEWCCHESVVGLYNTEKPEFEKGPPSQILKVTSCIRCVAFHSQIPSLLAAGLYSGEVIVWDLKHDEEVLVNKKKGTGDEAPHVDVITSLRWKEDDYGLWLVTAGRDGRVIVWKVTVTNLTYEVHQKFLILKQHLINTAAPDEHLEVFHMDFQPKGSYFVTACSGGTIFYCSTAMARSVTYSFQYKDPVLHSYKPRKGIVTHISCDSDKFASCGTDSEIHIFKYDQESPVFKIYTKYPLLGVQWNSSKELVSWGDSTLEYHKMQSSDKRSLIFEIKGNISTVAFNIPRKFAVGSHEGDVLILRDWIST